MCVLRYTVDIGGRVLKRLESQVIGVLRPGAIDHCRASVNGHCDGVAPKNKTGSLARSALVRAGRLLRRCTAGAKNSKPVIACDACASARDDFLCV